MSLVELTRNAGDASSGEALRNDPPHVWSGGRVRVEPVQAPAPGRVRPVRMRAGVDQAVAVRGSAAEMAALQFGLARIAAVTRCRARETSRWERTPSRSSRASWRGLSKSTEP
jgi:hypothetical protein